MGVAYHVLLTLPKSKGGSCSHRVHCDPSCSSGDDWVVTQHEYTSGRLIYTPQCCKSCIHNLYSSSATMHELTIHSQLCKASKVCSSKPGGPTGACRAGRAGSIVFFSLLRRIAVNYVGLVGGTSSHEECVQIALEYMAFLKLLAPQNYLIFEMSLTAPTGLCISEV